MMDDNMMLNMYTELSERVRGKIAAKELLKKHTYFKIGGEADILIEPDSTDDLKAAIDTIRKYKANYYIIGNGTNLLFSDKGFKGVIVKIGSGFASCRVHGNSIIAGSGTLLSVMSQKALEKGLTGLEFASGIPGYLGGALSMNAGAYGGEMKDIASKVKCIDPFGNEYEFSNEEMKFGYRSSFVSDTDMIITEAELTLKEGDKTAIKDRMAYLSEQRTSKQPLNMPSAGSTFKRPETGYASKLIEDAGLKGLIYGGAMVSDKHSGFIVNRGDATCEDVLGLMRMVISTVKNKFGIVLEPEVKIIGEKL